MIRPEFNGKITLNHILSRNFFLIFKICWNYLLFTIFIRTHLRLQQIMIVFQLFSSSSQIFLCWFFAAIPKVEAKTNSNLAILITSHGGHIGFLEGRNPLGTNYCERVVQQYVKAVFENRERVQTMSRYDATDLPEPSNADAGPSRLADIMENVELAITPDQVHSALV